MEVQGITFCFSIVYQVSKKKYSRLYRRCRMNTIWKKGRKPLAPDKSAIIHRFIKNGVKSPAVSNPWKIDNSDSCYTLSELSRGSPASPASASPTTLICTIATSDRGGDCYTVLCAPTEGRGVLFVLCSVNVSFCLHCE